MARKAGQDVDAIIVGGGPAGTMAAVRLAEAGKRALLLEREAMPRYKPCGGGLVWRARDRLPFDIGASTERECRRILISYRKLQRELVVEDQGPLVSMVMRADFDRRLAEHARSLGVEVVEAVGPWRLQAWQDRVELDLAGKAVHARWLIGADGARSQVARESGWRPFRHLAPAIECELPVDAATRRRFGETARFDFDFPAGGYGWVFPKREHLSVGVASLSTLAGRGLREPLKRTLAGYLHRHHLPAAVEEHGYVIPIAPRPDGVARGRVMLVGDAAGLADPVMAEGLSHAMISGLMVADAIIDGDADDSAVDRYTGQLKRELLPELARGRWLGRLLYGSGTVRNRLLDRHGQGLAGKMAGIFRGDGRYRDIQARSLRL